MTAAANGSGAAGWATEYLELIDDCEARESRLDAWSRNFLASLREQLEAGQMPTAKQAAKLDEIWERATARG